MEERGTQEGHHQQSSSIIINHYNISMKKKNVPFEEDDDNNIMIIIEKTSVIIHRRQNLDLERLIEYGLTTSLLLFLRDITNLHDHPPQIGVHFSFTIHFKSIVFFV